MKRLFNIEWNKIFYNKGTRIFIILYFLMIILMGIILPNFKPYLNGFNINFIDLGALEFPVIWHNITWLVGFGKYFLAIIVINNITNEYSFGTFKQNTIDGLTKTEFFQSKVLMNIIITLFSTLIVGIIIISLGIIFSKNTSIFNGIEFLFGYFIEVLTFIIISMFLSFLLRKNAFVILAIIALNIGETTIKGIEYYFRLSNLSLDKENNLFLLSRYLPFKSNGEIIDYPNTDVANFMAGKKLFVPDTIQWDYLGINIFYIILFSGLTLFLIKKRDL